MKIFYCRIKISPSFDIRNYLAFKWEAKRVSQSKNVAMRFEKLQKPGILRNFAWFLNLVLATKSCLTLNLFIVESKSAQVLISEITQLLNEGQNRSLRAKLWPWDPEKRLKPWIFRNWPWLTKKIGPKSLTDHISESFCCTEM